MATILLIEDDRIIRNLVVNVMEDSGHKIIQAEDGDEGLSLAAQHNPDLVITDILMPKVDGINVIETLKKNDPDCRIIAMSAGGFNRKEYYLSIANVVGSSCILSKPFKPKELISLVETTLK
ncbi:MAG: response regulator [Pontiellaceae bacterium]|nr:response regulator [Pontiellaceae bacterium]MBN2785910.1 response regulator [Pontiellaceae bacterium]